jgi:hypothetical protein
MKKMILSWLLIGSSCMVFAQNETGDTTRPKANTYDSTSSMNNKTNNTNSDSLKNNQMNTTNPPSNANNTMSSTNQSNAYANMPARVQMNLQKDYPSANNITWTQSGEWYQGTYGTGGRYTRIYYNQRGDTYSVSLPVTQTYVPDDIVSKAGSMFGQTIYDIAMLKQDSTHNIYQIRTAENGVVKAQWIAEDGSAVMDPFRSDVTTETNTSTNAAMGQTTTDSTANMNNNNMNKQTTADSTNMNMNKTDSTGMNMNRTDSAGNMKTDSTMNRPMSTDSTRSTDSTSASSGSTGESGTTGTGDTIEVKVKTKAPDGQETKTKTKTSGEAKKEY